MKINENTSYLLSVLTNAKTKQTAEKAIALVIAGKIYYDVVDKSQSLNNILNAPSTVSNINKYLNAYNEILPIPNSADTDIRAALIRIIALANPAIMLNNISTYFKTINDEYVEEEDSKEFIKTYKAATMYFVDYFGASDHV